MQHKTQVLTETPTQATELIHDTRLKTSPGTHSAGRRQREASADVGPALTSGRVAGAAPRIYPWCVCTRDRESHISMIITGQSQSTALKSSPTFSMMPSGCAAPRETGVAGQRGARSAGREARAAASRGVAGVACPRRGGGWLTVMMSESCLCSECSRSSSNLRCSSVSSGFSSIHRGGITSPDAEERRERA